MYTTAATYGTEQDRMIFGEKSDHLGNVRAVVSDVRKPVDITGDIDDWTWTADVTQSFAYYPFGMQMPGQANTAQTVENGGYKFGFNGKLRDDSWHNAAGTVYDYGFRIYDARIARFLSRDPLFASYPWYTPYQYAGNNPINYIDLDGLEEAPSDKDKYTIEKGDTYWDLAENSGEAYTVEDLEKWNPGVDPTKLQIGQEINISDPNKQNTNPSEIDPVQDNPVTINNNYEMQQYTISGGVQSIGPVIYYWTQYEIWLDRQDDASGYWENNVKLETNWTGDFGLGDLAGASKTTIKINKDVMVKLKTNSLVDILNYGSHKVTSHWGGYAGNQEGVFKGYSKDGILVWEMHTTDGFTMSYSPPASSSNVNWRINKSLYGGVMSESDSIKSALLNYLSGMGDTAKYGDYLRRKKKLNP